MRPQKYTFEQRKEWCEAYLKGEHVPTPLGARRATFIRELRDWARKYKVLASILSTPLAKRKDYPIAVILAAASLVASGEMSTKEAAHTVKAISPARDRTRSGRPTSANSILTFVNFLSHFNYRGVSTYLFQNQRGKSDRFFVFLDRRRVLSFHFDPTFFF